MFISVDPGDNVGVATFKADGTDINKTIMRLDKFRNFLSLSVVVPDVKKMIFIVEDYRLCQNMAIAQTGSDMPASRCIGAIEMVCEILGDRSQIYWQNPSNLRGALKWAGYPKLANKPRSWHCPDDLSAYAHGVHRLIDLGIRKHPIFGE
jgi:hypothetical protein